MHWDGHVLAGLPYEVDGHPSVLFIVLVPHNFERLWHALVGKCVGLLGKGVLSICS